MAGRADNRGFKKTMNIGWEFEETGSASGGNDGAVDIFMGQRVQSIVRETIQNSLDAFDKKKQEPVRIDFSLHQVDKELVDGLDELHEHLLACASTAKVQGNESKVSLYSTAAKEISSKSKVLFLCISDFNTTGLFGSTDVVDAKGPWIALVKGQGLTQKPENSLGSFGHGSAAPFAMAKLRTIFYLSETTNLANHHEIRFQGKSLLQAHRFKNADRLRSNVGYYGIRNNEMPLLDDEVPEWAAEIRAKAGSGKGTSILIPHTNFDEGLFGETLIVTLANFFYVIKLGKLIVTIDGKEINQKNVEEQFIWAKENLEKERDFIDYEKTLECFQTIETIINHDKKHSQEIPGFGRIDWYLRLEKEDISGRNVAIARESGMFITRKAPQLERFPGLKAFDMFIRVDSGIGSQTLLKMEDPQHTNLQIDRIDDVKEREKAQGKYNSFVKKVREVLRSHAKLDISEEIEVDIGDDLFVRENDSPGDDSSSERGGMMYISDVVNTRPRAGNKGSGSTTGITTTGGEGATGTGKGKRQKKGGPNPSPIGEGNAPIEGGIGFSLDSAKQAEALRVVRFGSAATGLLKVNFNCYKEGNYNLQLYKVGETDLKSSLKIRIDGEIVDAVKIYCVGDRRESHTLELVDKNANTFALEAWLNEIK